MYNEDVVFSHSGVRCLRLQRSSGACPYSQARGEEHCDYSEERRAQRCERHAESCAYGRVRAYPIIERSGYRSGASADSTVRQTR
jgi:hypothetical protein